MTNATVVRDTRRREMQGRVIRDAMMKTRVVEIERQVRHTKYGHVVRRFTRVKAHDADNATHVGDIVRLRECRPLSKDKRWMIVR